MGGKGCTQLCPTCWGAGSGSCPGAIEIIVAGSGSCPGAIEIDGAGSASCPGAIDVSGAGSESCPSAIGPGESSKVVQRRRPSLIMWAFTLSTQSTYIKMNMSNNHPANAKTQACKTKAKCKVTCPSGDGSVMVDQ